MLGPHLDVCEQACVPAPLAQAHQALTSSLRSSRCKQTEVNEVPPAIDPLHIRHWSVRFLDFGYRARQTSSTESLLELNVNVYLSHWPFADVAFTKYVQPRLEERLRSITGLASAIVRAQKQPVPAAANDANVVMAA